MISHLVFYFLETTLITSMLWLGLFLATNALSRMSVQIRLPLSAPLILWIALFFIDIVASEALGPEFTLHYYFGIWILVGGGILWIVSLARQATASLAARSARKNLPVTEVR